MSFILAIIALILEVVYFAQTKSLELWFMALVLVTLAILAGGWGSFVKVLPRNTVG